ncbi:MAG TPA: hypothetical protein VLA71_11780, partial [Algoriphagus sp.]|nr:hypothetical protein [Algoriphagus sp.]
MSVTGEAEDSEVDRSPEDSIGTVSSETQNLRVELERISKELKDRKRELEVEAALEKVRSKAMSIQRSEDLRTVVQILYEQLRNLGFQWGVASITIMDQETGDIDWWMEGFGDGYVLPECYHVPFFDHPGHLQQLNPWKNGAPYAEIEISGQEKKSYDAYYFFKTDFARAPKSSKQLMMQQETVRFSMAYMKYGALSWSPSTLSKEQATILERFAKVFEQCYTRFLDLQKAEAQTREAQIEAALEKIRSRSLAMHHSGELREVITIFFEKLNELGVLLGTVGIALLDQQTKHLWYWVGNTIQDPQLVSAPYDKSMMGGVNFLSDSHIAIANRKEILNQTYTKEQKDRYFEHLFSHNDLTQIPEGAREVLRKMESHVVCFFPNKHSSLFADSWDGKKYSEDGIGILRRAARVFEQTYVRFLDLEKAEAQAREAQIETALEKVRSKSLAMHRSEELQEVVTTVFDRLKELDIQTDAINLDVFNENKKDAYLWTAVPGQNYSKAIHIPYTDSAIFKDIYNGMISGKLLHSKVYSRELKDEFLNYLFGHTDFREIPQERKDLLYSSDASTVSVAYAKNTAIIAQRYRNNPFSDDENEILKRFAKVFDQAYTRFLDLQKAEAQAREAQIEAALEKVRSSSLAMHNSDELKEVVKTVVEKIQDLDIEMNGGISMVTFEAGSHDFRHWLWIPGRLEDTFTAKVVGFDHPILADCRKAQDQGLELFSKVYGKKDKQRYFKHVFEKTDFKYGPKETKDWVMQQPFFGFSFAIQKHSGIFLNDYSGKYFSKETNDILVRFSRVFEQAYVRFLDLQKAEAQAREAQ